jgi:hypothetical protein
MSKSHAAPRSGALSGLALLFCLLPMFGCSEDGGAGPGDDPIPTTESVVFERYRDSQTGMGIPVLTERGSGFDAREVDSPAVVFDPVRPAGDAYMLFYEASDASGVSRIGLVTSSTAEFSSLVVGRTPVLSLGSPGSGFEAGVTDPTVVVLGGEQGPRYRMWIEGRGGNGGAASTIFTTTSEDGVSWDDLQACTGLSPSYATVRVADPCVVVDGALYRMWFEAEGAGLGLGAIGYAESNDGVAWTLRDAGGVTGAAAAPVLSPRGGTAFDAAGVHAPSVTEDATADPGSAWRWQLWYEASDAVASTQSTLGVAISSDGLSWTRLDAPILAPASDSLVPLPFDSGDLEHPAVWIDEAVNPGVTGHFLLWYTGDGEANVSPNRVGLARGRLAALEAAVLTP